MQRSIFTTNEKIKERMQIANITLAKYLKISRNKVDKIIKKTQNNLCQKYNY